VQGTPLVNINGPVAPSAPARDRSPRAHERRRALIASTGILLVAGLGFVLPVTAELPMSPLW
jgi:hypothetical protein